MEGNKSIEYYVIINYENIHGFSTMKYIHTILQLNL